MELRTDGMYVDGINATQLAAEYGTPLYVYDEQVVRERARKLRDAITWPYKKILYACKANNNFEILCLFLGEGLGIDAVSPFEIEAALACGFSPDDIIYTGNNVTDEEMKYAASKGVLLTMDSLSQLERYGKLFPGKNVLLRINPGVGAGHHNHTITGGAASKFGIYLDKIQDAAAIANKYDLKVIGLHQHIGSGILDAEKFLLAADILFSVAKNFGNLELIDFGGGIGVPYQPGDRQFDLTVFGNKISAKFKEFCESYGKELKLVVESGRFLVCEAGILLARVNTVKETPTYKFAGLDTGFNHLIRPAMYGSHHEIVNATAPFGEKEDILVAGNICESGDIFTRNEKGPAPVKIAKVKEGNLIAILNAGAYGFSMASEYNLRPLPAEVMVTAGKSKLVRRRGNFKDLVRNQV